jgi:hypothetical protein
VLGILVFIGSRVLTTRLRFLTNGGAGRAGNYPNLGACRRSCAPANHSADNRPADSTPASCHCVGSQHHEGQDDRSKNSQFCHYLSSFFAKSSHRLASLKPIPGSRWNCRDQIVESSAFSFSRESGHVAVNAAFKTNGTGGFSHQARLSSTQGGRRPDAFWQAR